MYKFATAIGLDIGRSVIRSALVRNGGQLIDTFSFPLAGDIDYKVLTGNVVNAINKTRSEASSHGINPLCIGIAAKGFIDHREGVVIGPDQGVSGWNDIALGRIVKEAVGLPAYIDNDANMMAIAEYYYGSASGYRNIIYITLRSGIGGAIIIDGKLYRGNQNAAGEIGQMIIRMNEPGGDSINGSLEQLASSIALVRRYNESAVQNKSGPGELSSASEVFESCYGGNAMASAVIDENASYIGIGLANIISIFSPEIVVLGGGMAMARDSYIERIREYAYANSLEHCRKNVAIERASLGIQAPMLGAAAYALARLDGKQI